MIRKISVVLILFTGFCVSLRIEIPEDPEGIIGYIAVVKSLKEGFHSEKEIENEDISTRDKFIYTIVKIKNVSFPHKIQWKWYGPKNNLVKDSKEVEVNKGKKYLEYFAAYDRISNDLFKGGPGKWTVVILIDTKFFSKTSFFIKEIAAEKKS